jgi:hypothetical protein
MPRTPLKAARGYEFVKKGKGVMLRRKGSTGVGTTFSCTCQDGTGGCRVDINGDEASCMNNGCSGTCRWSVNLPGLSGMTVTMRAIRKPRRDE